VFGVKIRNRLFVANIGDSRCVLAQDDGAGGVQALALSIDHKPELPLEEARILAAGGRVQPLPGPPGEDCGPPRVCLQQVDVPRLAMSRSIGDDVSQTVGVISVPEIMEHEIQPSDQFVIWASDGVWEFISSQEAVNIVHPFRGNLHQAAARLVEESCTRWKREEEVIDDVTCVILAFDHAA